MTDKKVTLSEEHNTLVVRLENHTWVSLAGEKGELCKRRTRNRSLSFSLPSGSYVITSDGEIIELSTKWVEKFPSMLRQSPLESDTSLRLTTDAPDRHIVDGIGEIPADGTSFCTITVEKAGLNGQPLAGEEHGDELYVRTTGGMIMDAEGKKRIRSLQLKAGRGSFRLVSESQPKLVTVSVFGRDPAALKAEIQTEFVSLEDES